MKLRLKGDSVRIRVTQGELQQLRTQGRVEDRTRFPGGEPLVYRLTVDQQLGTADARFERGALEVRLPAAAARRWCESELVGLFGTQCGDGVELRIAVEKDFACLQPREGENESDQFPHP